MDDDKLLNSIFVFKSEHTDYPHDIYITLKCEASKDYISNFPCTGRVVTKNDPEIDVQIDKEKRICISSKETDRCLITIPVEKLFFRSIKDVVDDEVVYDIGEVFVFVFKPNLTELLGFDNALKTRHSKIFIDEI